ncbi:hypothetical protein [Catellatospora methionotrophica]|uniref:hypothetical protein n=1 Tax=Catellatospora methionotrophica TaxID=121620 RepID=UPI00340F8EAB
MMRVVTATEAAPGRVNEDQVFHHRSVVGVLDGVTVPEGFDTGCAHGAAWYSRRLVTHLAGALDDAPDASLAVILGSAIERVTRDHPGCDLANPSTAAATVCLVRDAGSELEYLILCDSSLVVDTGAEPVLLVDDRFARSIQRIRDDYLLGDVPIGSEVHQARRIAANTRKRELTNTPEGYWIAAADPEAAAHALTGRFPLLGEGAVRRAALLTDGASCAVDTFGLYDWTAMLDLITENGPHELIRQVRIAETADADGRARPRFKSHDDATVALCVFGEES